MMAATMPEPNSAGADNDSADNDSADKSLSKLVELNQQKLASFLQHPLFKLAQDGTLEDSRKREVFLRCVLAFSEHFQRLMFTRQALGVDPHFAGVFRQHLMEEIDHDRILSVPENVVAYDDSLLDATLSWFSYQVILLDNADRTVLVHLVLETAGDAFLSAVHRAIGSHLKTEFFKKHTELDPHHAQLGLRLLHGCDERTLQRLVDTSHRGWAMLDNICDRIATIVNKA